MASSAAPLRLERVRQLLTGLLIAGTALWMRWSYAPGVFTERGTFIGGLDGYYHARRLELALEHNGLIPQFDHYVNFPSGAWIDWPPGFDLLLAAFVAPIRWFAPGLAPETIASALVPLLGALGCLLLWRLGRRWFGPRAGAIAGLLLALSVPHIDYTMVGRVDHHVMEPLLLTGLLALLPLSLDDRRKAALVGLAMALAPAFWPGAIAFSGPLAVAWALWSLRAGKRAPLVPALTAAGVALLLGLSTPWGQRGELAYYALSMLQPAFFAIVAAVLAGLGFALQRGLTARQLVVGGAGAALLGLVVLPFTPAAPAALRTLNYLTTSEAQISTVFESQPLWALGLREALAWHSPLLLLWPLLPLFLVRRIRAEAPGGQQALALQGLLHALLLMGGLSFLQTRMTPFAAVPLCLTGGALLDAGLSRVLPGGGADTPVARRLLAGLAGVGLALAVGLPGGRRYLPRQDATVGQLRRSLDALLWLGEVAPETRFWLEPWEQPSWGVASSWIFGHWINWFSHKPNIANPLGQTDVNLEGIRRTAELFLAPGEAEAWEVTRRDRARFLFLTPLHEQDLQSLLLQTGGDLNDWIDVEASREALAVRPRLLSSFHSRLYLDDGRAQGRFGGEFAPIERYRLMYESAATVGFGPAQIAYAKVFEAVVGALLEVPCEGPVSVELALTTNRGRSFVWSTLADPQTDGVARLRVPYATEALPHSVAADGPYQITCEGAQQGVDVTLQQTATGARIQVAAPPSAETIDGP